MKIAKKTLISIGTLLFLFSLAACKPTEQSDENKVENEESTETATAMIENGQQHISYTFTNPNTGQEFNIVHAYMLYDDFFDSVKKQPEESLSRLFEQTVVDPVFDSCFKDNHLWFSALGWTPKKGDFDIIRKEIASINRDQLNTMFEESLIKSSDVLPSAIKTTVCVYPENEKFPSQMLVTGPGKIAVFFKKLDHYYKTSMSHEYHHSVWFEKNLEDNYSATLLDHLIIEGQAVMFETLVYPDLNNTAHIVDERFNKEYWNKIEPYLESVYSDRFVLGGSDGLPYNYGYSEGYKIIRSYLSKHPDLTVEEWTSKNPREIFEESDYLTNYE